MENMETSKWTGEKEPAAEYDLVVIGGGPAGYTAALEAASRGMKTALAENRELGGTCLNRGCIPTKTILHSAELFAQMQDCGKLGLHAERAACDMASIQARKDEVVAQLRGGIAMLMKKNKIDVYERKAQLAGPHEVLLTAPGGSGAAEEHTMLRAGKILIATGSSPALPPIPGIGLENVVTSDELLSRTELFPRLTIIGGGVIGMEFASIYNALGCQVTVIEFLDRILANMDREISQNLKMILKKRGVDIHTGAQVQEILRSPDGSLICRYTEKDGEKTVESDGVLAAVGRKANTEGLFANGTELAMNRGRILVNEYGRTSLPDVYAAGDVTPGIQLAHAAAAQGTNAVAHMAYLAEEAGREAELARIPAADAAGRIGEISLEGPAFRSGDGFRPPLCADVIPGCVYTDPEIGCVGITQEEAKLQGRSVIVKKYPMSANGKTVLSGQDRGFIKVIADADSHVVLGAQMMCARATDMISEFGMAVVNGLTLEQMASVVRPHPTFSEAIGEAVR